MSIQREHIIWMFNQFLARDPESEKVIENYQKKLDITHGIKTILSSPEYLKKNNQIQKLAVSESTPLSSEKLNIVDLDSPRIVFLHTPKTGGTSLHSMLKMNFKEQEIFPDRYDALLNVSLHNLLTYKYFSGHFDFLAAASIPGNTKLVTMLREPISRILSHYYFYRAHVNKSHPNSHVMLANNLSLKEFFSHPDIINSLSFNNAYASNFLGLGRLHSWQQAQRSSALTGLALGKQEFSSETNDFLNQNVSVLSKIALKNLEKMDSIGILENMDLSVQNIFKSVGFETPKKITRDMDLKTISKKGKNYKKVIKEPITDELLDLVEPLVHLDKIIYQRALEIFNKQTSDL